MNNVRYAALAVGMAVTFIAGWEGKHNKAYLDLVNVPTICYGTTKNVRLGDVKDDNECMRLLRAEIERIDRLIDRHVVVELKPYERAALISFTYNVGDGGFLASDARKRFNRGDHQGGCNALATRYTDAHGVCRGYGCGWAKGKMVRGLQNRRLDERSLCLGEKQ